MPAGARAKMLEARDLDTDDQAIEIPRQQQVAAAAEYETRQRLQLRVSQQFGELLRVGDPGEVRRTCLDAKGVAMRETDIAFDRDEHRGILGASA